MSSQAQNNSSSFLKIKLEELGIDMLLNAYNDIQADYNKNITAGDMTQAKEDLKKMGEINSLLQSAIKDARYQVNNLYRKGIQNQAQVIQNNPELVSLTERLNKDEMEIISEYNNLRQITSEDVDVTLLNNSNYFRYIVMFILAIIFVGLTIRAFATNTSNNIENIILVLAIGLAIYYIVEKIYKNETRT